MDVTVFYAWQDDRPGKCNRYLIRDAAKDACKRITEDASNDFNVRLDQDTAGRPGMCDIPNTILEKIRECNVLLADLTFVGKTDPASRRDKQISNPNVLMELGYAVGSKAADESDGFERVIGVMNTAYGKPEDQMFDVKRRRPITYKLPETSDGTTVRQAEKSLSEDLEKALIIIFNEAVKPGKEETGTGRFLEIRDQFEQSIRDGSFHDLFLTKNVIAVTLAPDKPHDIDYEKLQAQSLATLGRWVTGRQTRARSVIARHKPDSPEVGSGPKRSCSIAELNSEGTILAADVFFLYPPFHRDRSREDDKEKIIPSRPLETELIDCVGDNGKILAGLDIEPPWRLGISFLGIRGFSLYAGFDSRPTSYPEDDLITDSILIRDTEDATDYKRVARLLKGTFDYIWQEFGYRGSCNYDEQGNRRPR